MESIQNASKEELIDTIESLQEKNKKNQRGVNEKT